MPEKIYEIISLAARYWFALLGVVIVLQSFTWLRRDRREKHRRLRQLPDAGMIGEMVVIAGSDELPEGASLPVPREGSLGYLRTCDVVVPVEGVAHQHCDFTFIPGKGLHIYPRSGQSVLVDGETVQRRKHSKQHPMHHGSRLEVGEAVLRLRVFVGLEVERHSTVMQDEEAAPQEQTPWQEQPYVYHQVPAAWQETTGPFPPVPPCPPQQGYQQPYQQPCGQPYQPPYQPYEQPYEQSYEQPYEPDPSYGQPYMQPDAPDEPPAYSAQAFEPRPRRRRVTRRWDDGEA